MSKVGLLVECGRDGLEVHVCRRICELLAHESGAPLDIDIVPMDNKQRLLEECGAATRYLLAGGCKRVIILWDERPAWPKVGQKLCLLRERAKICSELEHAGVANRPVHPVCVRREFESWLLFDHRMIACVLSTPAHPVRVRKQKHPDRMENPKGAMMTLFRKLAGKRYVDREFARRLAGCLQDLSHLRQCPTFRRFEKKLTG